MDAWYDETPLYIWSGGQPTDLSKIKAAKAALDDGITEVPKVKPVNCGPTGADGFNYLEGRILAVGSKPPFLCDYFLIGEDAGQEEVARALAWVLRLVEEDERANTLLDAMTAIFGPGTREVPQEELDAQQKLREYQRNLQ